MDARDICRRLNCSPMTLSDWLDKGCPAERYDEYPPGVGYCPDQVRKWLADNDIRDWPKESDEEVDDPMRVILKTLERKEITPRQAEKVITNVGGLW